MQTISLVKLFNNLKGTGKQMRFGDLMKKGYNPYLIKAAIEKAGVNMDQDQEGYTIVLF